MILATCALNMTVHSVMYSYYFASLFIKDFNKIASIKKSITAMQMVSVLVLSSSTQQFFFVFRVCLQVQFTLILVNCFRAYYTDCGVPNLFLAFFIPNILIIFYQFYQFYEKTYKKRSTDKHQKAA
jgi:hypothetical protein